MQCYFLAYASGVLPSSSSDYHSLSRHFLLLYGCHSGKFFFQFRPHSRQRCQFATVNDYSQNGIATFHVCELIRTSSQRLAGAEIGNILYNFRMLILQRYFRLSTDIFAMPPTHKTASPTGGMVDCATGLSIDTSIAHVVPPFGVRYIYTQPKGPPEASVRDGRSTGPFC